MRVSKADVLAVAIGALLLCFPVFALADTYQVSEIGGGGTLYGIDVNGLVVKKGLASDCGLNQNICYTVIGSAVGQPSYFQGTPPMLNYDNGTPCSPNLPAGAVLYRAVCNNGRVALVASFGTVSGVFSGLDPATDLLMAENLSLQPPIDALMMNGLGDIAWTRTEFFEAVNLTAHAPEPGTLVLLGTGVLGMAGMARRRMG